LSALAALAVSVAQASAAPRERDMTSDLIGQVRVLAPAEEPTAFVFYISDTDGVTSARVAEAESLAARGAAVALVDLKEFIKRQAASDDATCHYAFGDLEDLARSAQRELAMKTWRWPVILGLGEGGTAAYLNIAQAPHNTAAGAVSIGFRDHLASKLPFCPGAPDRGKDDEGYRYAPMTAVPGRWTLVTATPPDAEAQSFLDASAGTRSLVAPGGDEERFRAGADAVFEIAALPTASLADLPLVELPAQGGDPAALFVLISGDGGWRDIDKQIGEFLSQHGVGVVGVDALRYFWSKKSPAETGADLARIVAFYSEHWKTKTVGIGGYSLGADVLPPAWGYIKPAMQSKISRIVLMGIAPTAELQVTVTGWLGMSGSSETDLRPSLAMLPKEKVMCFYGVDEKKENETSCVFKELDGAKRFERPGGHHFDGDYETIARLVLEELDAAVAVAK
jgi:type IV secretory pathway VirJ component